MLQAHFKSTKKFSCRQNLISSEKATNSPPVASDVPVLPPTSTSNCNLESVNPVHPGNYSAIPNPI